MAGQGSDDVEAAVDTLSFAPLLHFRAAVGPAQRYLVEGRSRAPVYLVQGGPLQVRHRPSGWCGTLRCGELLFLPRAGAHELATDVDAPATTIADCAALSRDNGRRTYTLDHPQPAATLVGSFFWTAELQAEPLLARLPEVVHLQPRRCGSERWLEPMGRLMRWMTEHDGGAGVGLNESANTLLRHVVLALAKADEGPRDPSSVNGALRDAGLAPALRAIHTTPAEDWSVERLAALCHLSRTAFAARFRRALGVAPMRYLTRWRMGEARRLMAGRALSLDQVAERVGYSSGYAFSKAYKRETRSSPRRSMRAGQAASPGSGGNSGFASPQASRT